MKKIFNVGQPLSRKEFWIYQVYLFIIGFLLEMISRTIFSTSSIELSFTNWSDITIVNIIKIIFIIMTLVNIIFQSKRLLDIGYPKSISLLSLFTLGTDLLTLIGSIPIILCLFLKSKKSTK